MIVIVMGVAGSGKSTVGRALADELGWAFIEGDELHSPESIEKMARGIALDDADRIPWLAAVARAIETTASSAPGVVVACSALRERYRMVLDPAGHAYYVHLVASREVLTERLARRSGHFFPLALLESQLAALEPPKDALAIDATLAPDEAVRTIRRHLDL
jgi:gluconokinase